MKRRRSFSRDRQVALHTHLCGVITLSGRHILGVAIFFMGMSGAFRVISGIFNPLDRSCLERLICVGKFFDGFFVRVANFREPLRTHTLAGTVFADLRGISAEFIQLCLQIAFTLGRAFVGRVEPFAGIPIRLHARFITPQRPIG